MSYNAMFPIVGDEIRGGWRFALPWVSRRAYDQACARAMAWEDHVGSLQAAREDLEEDLRAERKRYDALLEKYHALKVTGAAPEPVKPTIQPLPNLTPSDYAIESRVSSVPDTRRAALRRYLVQWRDGQKQLEGMTDEVIAKRITNWQDATGTDD